MTTLISNGRWLYRWNGSLLRTPIIKRFTLFPESQALFPVGNDYVQVLPTGDFFTHSGIGTYSIMAGHSMRKCYLGREIPSHNSSGWAQIWRHNNSYSQSFDPGFVFYNGNYSPARGLMGGAAYLQLPAYMFSLPTSVTGGGWKVDSMTMNLATHGVVITSGSVVQKQTDSRRYPVFAMDANTTLLPANSDWREAGFFVTGAFSTSYLFSHEPYSVYNVGQQVVEVPNVRTDAASNDGTGFPLWITWPSGAVRYVDGHVINAAHPHVFHVSANPAMCAAASELVSSGGFAIPMIPPVGDSGANGSTITVNDYPAYTGVTFGGASNWWLCERYQMLSIDIAMSYE